MLKPTLGAPDSVAPRFGLHDAGTAARHDHEIAAWLAILRRGENSGEAPGFLVIAAPAEVRASSREARRVGRATLGVLQLLLCCFRGPDAGAAENDDGGFDAVLAQIEVGPHELEREARGTCGVTLQELAVGFGHSIGGAVENGLDAGVAVTGAHGCTR
jgi:hypothetical protein